MLVTLLGALPVYTRVAAASPNGQGSIGMLEKLFPQWSGKTFVLILLGFATTDFIITMTLSAADAAAHFTPKSLHAGLMKSQMGVTLFLLASSAAIFLKGFKEAIGVAVVLVGIYLALNVVVTGVGCGRSVAPSEPGRRMEAGAVHEARQSARNAGASRWCCSRSWRWGCPASKPE